MKKFFLFILFLSSLYSCSSDKTSLSESVTSEKMGILLPAYIYPDDTIYNKIISSSLTLKENLIVIINPNNGPITADSYAKGKYKEYIKNIQKNGSKVIGYVYTNYGNRSLAQVKYDIDQWESVYGVNGVFLDETSSSLEKVDYYKELYEYSLAKNGMFTVNNHGIVPHIKYKEIPTIKIIFEDSSDSLNSKLKDSNYLNWVKDTTTYDRNSMLIYDSPKSLLSNIKAYNSKWIYITDDVLDNPWDTLPSFYEELVNVIK